MALSNNLNTYSQHTNQWNTWTNSTAEYCDFLDNNNANIFVVTVFSLVKSRTIKPFIIKFLFIHTGTCMHIWKPCPHTCSDHRSNILVTNTFEACQSTRNTVTLLAYFLFTVDLHTTGHLYLYINLSLCSSKNILTKTLPIAEHRTADGSIGNWKIEGHVEHSIHLEHWMGRMKQTV